MHVTLADYIENITKLIKLIKLLIIIVDLDQTYKTKLYPQSACIISNRGVVFWLSLPFLNRWWWSKINVDCLHIDEEGAITQVTLLGCQNSYWAWWGAVKSPTSSPNVLNQSFVHHHLALFQIILSEIFIALHCKLKAGFNITVQHQILVMSW